MHAGVCQQERGWTQCKMFGKRLSCFSKTTVHGLGKLFERVETGSRQAFSNSHDQCVQARTAKSLGFCSQKWVLMCVFCFVAFEARSTLCDVRVKY
uniref:Uncharacterized protein n=1 Tax=Rhipicephalus zambeziensis TaxID=60191 RepID=A0A224YGF1_9ACAR